MKHIALLSFIYILLSCQSEKSNLLIKGDWIGTDQSRENTWNQTKFISFEDSTCRTSIWKDDCKYEILKDTLYIEKWTDHKIDQVNEYAIVKLTTDSLFLLPATKLQDTLKFSKVPPKNNITPSAIYFGSSGCFGTCPNMYLEIDSSLNIRFYGGRHTSIKGGFSGKISRNEYNSIISKIRNLTLDSLKEHYDAPWTDDQTLGMAVKHGDTIIHSSAYGHYQEPMELHLLYGKLMNVYKHVNMRPDPSVNETYAVRKTHEMIGVLGLPPPPIILPQKFTPPASHK